MKPRRNDRMVIAYMPEVLHKKIRIYCLKHGISLAKWCEIAHESLSTVSKK
jgi:hypothetical protein